jgi:hypothetical protein
MDMTQEEIKYNKLCADLMGWKNLNDDSYPEYLTPMGDFYSLKNLMFDSDWNWIMEVVSAIERLKNKDGYRFQVLIQDNICVIEESNKIFDSNQREYAETKKEATVQAIYKFLIWYNENT